MLFTAEAFRFAGSKVRVNRWIPASNAENAFFSPTNRELMRISWVERANAKSPTAVKTIMAMMAATSAKPF